MTWYEEQMAFGRRLMQDQGEEFWAKTSPLRRISPVPAEELTKEFGAEVYHMTPAEIVERFGNQQFIDMDTSNWPIAEIAHAGGAKELWLPKTEEDLVKYHSLLCGDINKRILDLKACGALKNAKGISDGYHTFGELYETRAVLNIALFKSIRYAYEFRWSQGKAAKAHAFSNPIWRSKLHSDGSMFDGMFILGCWNQPGHMITFHYHLDKWDTCDFAETLEKAPEWDGHTPAEALERIKAL